MRLQPPRQLVDFEAYVAPSGYRVADVQLEGSPRKWLIYRLRGREDLGRGYNPLVEYPALFKVFADLELSERAILEFAGKYGAFHVEAQIPTPSRLAQEGWRLAEPVSLWRSEIRAARETIDILSARHDQNEAVLGERFRPGSEGVSYHDPRSPRSLTIISRDEFYRRSKIGRIVEAAGITAHAYIWLRLFDHTSTYLDYSNQKDVFGLQIRPKNLLGAIWLQLADYATGKRDYRDCKLCGTWIALEPRFNRKDRLYCSNSCRQKAYRARSQ